MTDRVLTPIVSSFDPDADVRPARPRQSERRWPVLQTEDAVEAACLAGFAHFVREPNTDRARERYERLPEKARRIRRAETLAIVSAYCAAGGR